MMYTHTARINDVRFRSRAVVMAQAVRSLGGVALVVVVAACVLTGCAGPGGGDPGNVTVVTPSVEGSAGAPAVLRQYIANSSQPVMVYFKKEACGACGMFAPTFRKVSREYEGRAKFVQADVHRSPALVREYRIRATPTVVVFVGGVERQRLSGVRRAGTLRDMLDRAM